MKLIYLVFCEQTLNEEELLEPALIQAQPNESILHCYGHLDLGGALY